MKTRRRARVRIAARNERGPEERESSMNEKPVGVAVLGLGQRRQRGRPHHRGERRGPGRPHRRAAGAARRRRAPGGRRPRRAGRPAHQRHRGAGLARRRRHRRRGDGPGRTGPQGDPGRPREGQVGRDRQQGVDGAVHRRAGPGRRARPRRPVLRGRGRRCHPGHPPADAVAGGRHRAAGGRHRQRHHQLHPVGNGQHRRRLRGGAGRRERAGLRRGRPDRRRRGLRRRGQGRHPGLDRLPHPGHRRRRLPRGHHQGDTRRLRDRARPRAAPSSCCPSASGSPTTKDSNGFRPASTRRWCR